MCLCNCTVYETIYHTISLDSYSKCVVFSDIILFVQKIELMLKYIKQSANHTIHNRHRTWTQMSWFHTIYISSCYLGIHRDSLSWIYLPIFLKLLLQTKWWRTWCFNFMNYKTVISRTIFYKPHLHIKGRLEQFVLGQKLWRRIQV